MEKLRYTKNEVCHILSVSRDKLDKLIMDDIGFPRPIKEGGSRQAPVYFDTKSIHQWWNDKVEQSSYESNNPINVC